MTILNLKDFTEKYNLTNYAMKKFYRQKNYKYPIYPRDSKFFSDKGFVITDSGGMVGSH